MAARGEIVRFCDELLAPERWEDHGPNGLQVPGAEEVRRVATGVSATRDFLKRAVQSGAELAIAHHGLFWESAPRALTEVMAGRLRVALEGELSLLAYHLPLDAHREIGNNALLCRALGLELDERPFALHRGAPIGAIGRHDGLPAAELIGRVEAVCRRKPLVFDAGPELVRTVGIVSGGAAGDVHAAAALGLDAFLTGEPAEPTMGDAGELGIHFIAAGHYATETFGVRRLGELVAERFGVEHAFIDIPNPV